MRLRRLQLSSPASHRHLGRPGRCSFGLRSLTFQQNHALLQPCHQIIRGPGTPVPTLSSLSRPALCKSTSAGQSSVRPLQSDGAWRQVSCAQDHLGVLELPASRLSWSLPLLASLLSMHPFAEWNASRVQDNTVPCDFACAFSSRFSPPRECPHLQIGTWSSTA